MPEAIDMKNAQCGRWKVIERADNARRGQARWQCKCVCGKTGIVSGYDLRCGESKSCGCLRDEITAERSLIHGQSRRKRRTRTYTKWHNLRGRKETELPFLDFLKSPSLPAEQAASETV